ncbi:MAG: hypothetical protein ACR2P7_07485 [bacterium]
MVAAYILYCLRAGAKPCKYFQLNAPYFDREVGIFSKHRLDSLIPQRWRLAQRLYDIDSDDDARMPARYPVFVKPEWSQNAAGVHRADDAAQLRRIRAELPRARVAYLIQEGAREANEYEIFSIRHHRDPARYAILTVTHARNDRERDPINSVHNRDTRYLEITDSFTAAQRDRLFQLVRRIGDFGISRLSVRADSPQHLLRGAFHVIEINLFLPMPINLLDPRLSSAAVRRRVFAYMRALARLTRCRDRAVAEAPVFIKSMLYHRRGRLANWLRNRL